MRSACSGTSLSATSMPAWPIAWRAWAAGPRPSASSSSRSRRFPIRPRRVWASPCCIAPRPATPRPEPSSKASSHSTPSREPTSTGPSSTRSTRSAMPRPRAAGRPGLTPCFRGTAASASALEGRFRLLDPWIQGQRLLAIRGGLRLKPSLLVELRPVPIGEGALRVRRYRVAVIGEGLVEVPETRLADASVEEHGARALAELDRARVVAHGLAVVAAPRLRIPALCQGILVLGVEGHRLVEGSDGGPK